MSVKSDTAATKINRRTENVTWVLTGCRVGPFLQIRQFEFVGFDNIHKFKYVRDTDYANIRSYPLFVPAYKYPRLVVEGFMA